MFNENKTRSHRILNIIFLLWLIGSLIVALTSTVEYIWFEDNSKSEITLREYTRNYCYDHEEEPTQEKCRPYWEEEKADLEAEEEGWRSGNYTLLSIISASISFAVVGITLIILNLPRKKK